MSSLAIKLIIAAVLVIAGWWFVSDYLNTKREVKNYQATITQLKAESASALDIAQDAAARVDSIGQVEVTVRDARNTYQRGYQDAKKNDPATAAFANSAITPRMRELAKARREARERSGCVGSGCPDNDEAQGARR